MENIEKQIDYWMNTAFEDLETAKILITKNRFLHGLFFCHLVIEKAIKAHVVKHTKEFAPRSHNLLFLSEKTNLELCDENELFLGVS